MTWACGCGSHVLLFACNALACDTLFVTHNPQDLSVPALLAQLETLRNTNTVQSMRLVAEHKQIKVCWGGVGVRRAYTRVSSY
jgi:hypothetical protein